MVGPTGQPPAAQPGWRPRGIELSENLGLGGGWAEFSDFPEGVTVYAAGSAGFTPGALRRGAK